MPRIEGKKIDHKKLERKIKKKKNELLGIQEEKKTFLEKILVKINTKIEKDKKQDNEETW